MSWIGGSLSSITGQLSNLTKDILTEGTEEVSDHATELKIAQDKITESQTIILSQKSETDRLKRIIHELEEKAESAELQINSISREYRTLLLEKEKEINELKQLQNEALLHHNLSSEYNSSPTSSNTGYHGGFASDDLDFGDNITMQHEINRLTQEVQRLRSEVKHWKGAAKQSNNGRQNDQDLNENGEQVLELKKQLKELESQLRHDKEAHQQEVVSLQDVHKHKLGTLRQNHKSEVEKFKQTIQDLENQARHGVDVEEGKTQDESEHLKSILTSVREEVETLQSERQVNLSKISDLTEQLTQAQVELSDEKENGAKLSQQIQEFDQKMKDLKLEYDKAQSLELLGDLQEVRRNMSNEARTHRQKSGQEKQELVNLIIDATNKQRDLRDTVGVLQEEQEAVTIETEKMVDELGHPEHQKLTKGIMDTIEKENLILKKKTVEQQEQITLLEKALATVTQERKRTNSNTESQEADDQATVLRQQIEQYEREIEQFEVVKSDWQNEKEALEDVLMDLRNQLKEKENALNIAEAEKGLEEVERQGRIEQQLDLLAGVVMETDDQCQESDSDVSTGDIGMDIEALGSKLELLTQANAELEYERDQLLKEKTSDNSQLLAFEQKLQEKDNTIAELTLEKEKLELHLDEQSNLLHEQLRDKDAAMAKDKEELEISVSETSSLKERLEHSIVENSNLQQVIEDKDKEIFKLSLLQESTNQVSTLQSQMEDVNTKLQTKTGELMEVQAEKTELENSLIELDTQHQEAMEQLMQIRNGLNKQINELKCRLQDSEKVTNELKLQSEAELEKKDVEIKTLQQSLDNKKGELEDLIKEKEKIILSLHQQTVSTQEHSGEESSHDGKDELIQMLMETRSKLQEKEEAVTGLEKQISEKEQVVQCLEEQVEDLELQTEEKDSRIASLDQQLASLREWEGNDDQQDDDAELSDLRDRNVTLEKEMIESRKALSKLQDLCDKKDLEMKELNQKMQSGAMAINDLHMDIKDLEDSMKREEKSSAEKVEKIKELRNCNEKYKERVSELEERERTLEKSNQELHSKLASFKEDKTERDKTQMSDTDSKLNTSNLDKMKICDLEKSNSELSNKLTDCDKQINLLEQNLETLTSEKTSLVETFKTKEQVLQTQIRELDSFVEGLKHDRDLDASCKGLSQKCSEKDLQIQELEKEVHGLSDSIKSSQESIKTSEKTLDSLQIKLQNLHEENENLKVNLNTAVASQTQLSDIVSEKESELSNLNKLKSELENHVQSLKDQLEDHELILSSLTSLEEQAQVMKEENERLKEEVKMKSNQYENDHVKTVNSDLESELQQAQNKIEELETLVASSTYQGEENVENLLGKDQRILNLEKSCQEYEDEIINLKKQLDSFSDEKDLLNKDSEKKEVFEEIIMKSAEKTTTMKQNARLESISSNKEHETNVLEEIEHLQKLLEDKDKVIKDLQINNTSLLKMLEGKGNNSNMLNVHQLEGEVRALKLEKEQMMAVMNEKSRECSNLKSEVHRLMNIVSAEKVALQKLQTDNNELMQRRETPERDDDMQREALQNLSRLVRDKDMEVQALMQKNETLVQVLQDSSQEGVSSLVQDKDNLTKQVATLQSEKEQMMTYVNQKHSENVAYHNEIQRLTALINAEAEKHSRLMHDFENLRPQYEDNKQALLKAQNELINYKQKYTELEVRHGELLQKSNVTETVDLSQYNFKLDELKNVQEKYKELQDSIREKDMKIQSLRQQTVDGEENVMNKDGEITSLRKQVDSLTFQIQGLQTENGDLRSESSKSQQTTEEQGAQVHFLKSTNDQLTLKLQEKDFEVRSLREKNQTLTHILQDQQQGEAGHKGQMEKLMVENESILSQARQLQQERDQAVMAVKQRTSEMQDLLKEAQVLKEREGKAHRELDRLRNHLLQIEEGYTKEALEAEEREKDLRNKLASVEEKLISSTSAVESATQNASLTVENLQQQLFTVAAQRDQAYLQISSLQEQSQQYSTSLANLQMVLEQFQQGRDSLVASETERFQRENRALQTKADDLERELKSTKESLEEAEDGLEAAARLSEKLDRKEEALAALKEEVVLRENALKVAEEEIQRLTNVRESKVDKLVIKNLFLGYLTTPKNQQQEVLRAIGGVLHFSQDDFNKINSQGGKGWMPGFLRFGGTSTPQSSPMHTPTRTPKSPYPSTPKVDKSFSELFVKFLEKESSPPPPAVRLPAEEMVADIQRQKPAYNPFTAPRHVAMPMQENYNRENESHLLMSSAPASPTLPMYPVAMYPTDQSATTSSAILKDVLSSR